MHKLTQLYAIRLAGSLHHYNPHYRWGEKRRCNLNLYLLPLLEIGSI